uniref:Uncharacterized protein n=1 Tax=Trichuris muris TaxID=70415 RepID=A0A5S6QCT1_TRIMR
MLLGRSRSCPSSFKIKTPICKLVIAVLKDTPSTERKRLHLFRNDSAVPMTVAQYRRGDNVSCFMATQQGKTAPFSSRHAALRQTCTYRLESLDAVMRFSGYLLEAATFSHAI